MKFSTILPLAVAAHGAAILSDTTPNQMVMRDRIPPRSEPWWGESPEGYVGSVERFLDDMVESAGQTIDSALQGIEKVGKAIGRELGSLFDGEDDRDRRGDRRRHRGGDRDGDRDGDRRGRQRDDESDKTIWDKLKDSQYTTRFVKLVEEYDDIKQRLQDDKRDHTLFVPTDRAFEDIPEHKKPSREFVEDILRYHIVPGRYPAGQIMSAHTLPTVLELRDLGNRKQRLRVAVGLLGIHINFYSKVVATNIMARNGVIHAVDRVLVPPPRQGRLINALPGRFSTFSLAMEKTQLGDDLHQTTQRGGTVFAPTNYAFMKLGPRMNEFLFSEHGNKYLRALLRYHVVTNETLYSDAFYEHNRRDNDRDRDDRRDRDRDDNDRRDRDRDDDRRDRDRDDRRHRDRDGRRDRDRDDDRDQSSDDRRDRDRNGRHGRDRDDRRDRDGRRDRDHDRDGRRHRDRDGDRDGDRDIWEAHASEGPGGNHHVMLQSLLGEKRISVDIRRWMGIISMTVNGWVRVSVQDGISQDGVVHVVESVLMPPRHKRPDENDPDNDYENDRMTVDELKDRLDRYLDDRLDSYGEL